MAFFKLGNSVNGLPWLVIDVTSAPYLADKTGAADCTSAINAAMVAAGEADRVATGAQEATRTARVSAFTRKERRRWHSSN